MEPIELVFAYRTAPTPEQRELVGTALCLWIRSLVGPYIFSRLVSKADAEDALQKTFEAIFERLDKFRGTTNISLAVWCFKIARAQVANVVREGAKERKKREALAILWEALMGSTQDDQLSDERLDRLQKALERMATRNRDFYETVRLRYFEELEYEEIAEICGVNEITVRKRISRGRKELREGIEEQL